MRLPTVADCAELYRQYHTPVHIQAHMRTVASLAKQLAQARAELGDPITVPLVEAAAWLHDLVRIPEQWVYLPATITPPLPHAEINYLLLRSTWPEVATIIREHSLMRLVEQAEPFSCLEAKILYYADKRVNNSDIVSLQQRLQLGQERWQVAQPNDQSAQLLPALQAVERDLFRHLSFSPHELTN